MSDPQFTRRIVTTYRHACQQNLGAVVMVTDNAGVSRPWHLEGIGREATKGVAMFYCPWCSVPLPDWNEIRQRLTFDE